MTEASKQRSSRAAATGQLPSGIRSSLTSYQFIAPRDYDSLGIDARDVPVGTFVARDHPPFLASRFGGNAYGFGIVEHGEKLSTSELEFLEKVDFRNAAALRHHYKKINSIYRKLGLLIRLSSKGEQYFLIPINWVSHSLEDIRDTVDEIERVLNEEISASMREHLTIGLLAPSRDLLVHEITARMSARKILILDSLKKLRQGKKLCDVVIVPKDLNDLLISLNIKRLDGGPLPKQNTTKYGTYIAGKIYDLLVEDGLLLIVAPKPFPRANKEVWLEFKSEEDLHNFLLFTHAYRSRKRYRGASGTVQRVHLDDFYSYLSGIFVYGEDLRRLAADKDPQQLTLSEIDAMPHLDLKVSRVADTDGESRWQKVAGPYFTTLACYSKLTASVRENWQEKYIIEDDFPENIVVYFGRKREASIRLQQLEQQERAKGMAGCSLKLLAEYRDTFTYLLAVLEVLIRLRDRDFPLLSELDLNRLHNPFAAPRNRYKAFKHIKQLLHKVKTLRRLEGMLNPDGVEGEHTRVLQNLEKLELLGMPPALLREIYLIVVGHTTMGRITFGKLPEKTLKSITDQVKTHGLEEIVDLLRVVRLMSMAEIAAALGERLTKEQGQELFNLYDEAIRVTANPQMEWDTLHDQQVGALGGAQSVAIRQMLKMFNLFEYVDSWPELRRKGPFQKEAMAGYDPARLEQIEQVLELVRIADSFKRRFYGRKAFSRPYFFRKLLNCQFHGTGHLLPLLGTRAGFILLWITINGSPANIINFNPLVRYELQDNRDRLGKVRTALETLDFEHLHLDYLAGVKKELGQGTVVYISDSGLQLQYNQAGRDTEVNFVDVHENVARLKSVLTSIKQSGLNEISPVDLREMNLLFRETTSYYEHLRALESRRSGNNDLLEKQLRTIEGLTDELQEIFLSSLFNPENLYDNLHVLQEHCPAIGAYLLPTFWQLYRIGTSQQIYAGETIPGYVLRCLKKFQALVRKDRDSLQDSELFYKLAQQQFGPMTGDAIGLSNAQIDALEDIVERFSTEPDLLQALAVALVLQEVGKLALYLEDYREWSNRVSHAEAGADILRKGDVLESLAISGRVRQLTIFLIEYHGLIGQVIRGEISPLGLEAVTSPGDELLFEAFFLHSVLAAAAYREGVLVEDVLDRFQRLRQAGLQVLRGELSWKSYVEHLIELKGRTLLTAAAQSEFSDSRLFALPHWLQLPDDEAGRRTKGEDVAAVERLFRMVGLADVHFIDVQMHSLGMPLNFIYHKKGLKTTGLRKFESELGLAVKVCQELAALGDDCRRGLLQKLSPGQDLLRIFGFEYLSGHLEVRAWLKLLIICLQAIDRYMKRPPHVLNFQELNLTIDFRHQLLSEELNRLSLEKLLSDGRLVARLRSAKTGLILRCDTEQSVVTVLFKDRLGVDRVLARLAASRDAGSLKKLYHRELKKLRNIGYFTEDYQRMLSSTFHQRLQEIVALAINETSEKMEQQQDFVSLEKLFKKLLRLVEENGFSDEQAQLVRDMYEFHLDRLRNKRLEALYGKIDCCQSKADLFALWQESKAEFIRDRQYLGREFERLVTERFDERFASL
ncbi:MAG: hypothetical protein JRJ12_13055 [Deltaproteobacteria bacterium]|nr:hypothetical protein [Deltaproteobacteria bacterium]MBW2072132.1 hypothetical protein [Deltaproteobacteria bacterium]